jgi:hypothetical protein
VGVAQGFNIISKWSVIWRSRKCKVNTLSVIIYTFLIRIFEKDGIKIIVDETTLEYINGSIIDYKTEMIKQAFEVVENPNAEIGCSCGTSFSPKEK